MEKAYRALKWGVVLPSRYLMAKLASQLYEFSWEEFQEMDTGYRSHFQVFSSIWLIHLLITLISAFLPGLAWLVSVSSLVTALLSAGLALLVIKIYVHYRE